MCVRIKESVTCTTDDHAISTMSICWYLGDAGYFARVDPHHAVGVVDAAYKQPNQVVSGVRFVELTDDEMK